MLTKTTIPQRPSDTRPRRPAWQDVAGRFGDERDCLASFLALEAAEVLAGVKPANLVNLPDRIQACGRNLLRLWREHGATVLADSRLAVAVMARRQRSALLLIYRPDTLDALLQRSDVRAFLAKAGYLQPDCRQDALGELQARFAGPELPHEVGVFLGYPLKDVAGFMGWSSLPFACQGPWKIYGRPEKSLELAECFRACRCRVAEELGRCRAAAECLRTFDPERPGPFFSAD